MITLGAIAALAVALVALWRVHRERERMRAELREGPMAYAVVHVPSGADATICASCAIKRSATGSYMRIPVYRSEWFTDVAITDCLDCGRAIPEPRRRRR